MSSGIPSCPGCGYANDGVLCAGCWLSFVPLLRGERHCEGCGMRLLNQHDLTNWCAECKLIARNERLA